MSYYEYLEAKFLQIKEKNKMYLNLIPEELMDADWQSDKSRESMTRVIQIKIHIVHKEMCTICPMFKKTHIGDVDSTKIYITDEELGRIR